MAMSNSDERDRVKRGPRLLAVKQAIFELGIGRTAIYELIKNGKLKTVTIGRRRLVPVEAIEELIAALANSGVRR
jgi:excisionase family DNA binding protein